MPGLITRGAGAPTPPTPFTNARSSILQTAGIPATIPFYGPNVSQSGGGSISLLGAAVGAGTASVVAILDGLQAAVQISVAPATVGLFRYPTVAPLGPLNSAPGLQGLVRPTYRIGFRVRRSAIGGNAGHNSGLIVGWDSQDVNGIPAVPRMRDGCFGIVGDTAGGWAFAAAAGGVELVSQTLQWPVATDLYCPAELVFTPGTETQAGSVEVWINNAKQFSYVVGGPFLPPVVSAIGTFGLNFAIWHLVGGAVAPDLIISDIWALAE